MREGVPEAVAVHLPGYAALPLVSSIGSEAHFNLLDHQGVLRKVVSSAGNDICNHRTTAFGALRSGCRPPSSRFALSGLDAVGIAGLHGGGEAYSSALGQSVTRRYLLRLALSPEAIYGYTPFGNPIEPSSRYRAALIGNYLDAELGGLKKKQGETFCKFPEGIADYIVYDKSVCTGGCAIEHEEFHMGELQGGKVCEGIRDKCKKKHPGNDSAALACMKGGWDDWLSTNKSCFECRAYPTDIACLEKKAQEEECPVHCKISIPKNHLPQKRRLQKEFCDLCNARQGR